MTRTKLFLPYVRNLWLEQKQLEKRYMYKLTTQMDA